MVLKRYCIFRCCLQYMKYIYRERIRVKLATVLSLKRPKYLRRMESSPHIKSICFQNISLYTWANNLLDLKNRWNRAQEPLFTKRGKKWTPSTWKLPKSLFFKILSDKNKFLRPGSSKKQVFFLKFQLLLKQYLKINFFTDESTYIKLLKNIFFFFIVAAPKTAAQTRLICWWMSSFLGNESSESKKQNSFIFCIELSLVGTTMKHFHRKINKMADFLIFDPFFALLIVNNFFK